MHQYGFLVFSMLPISVFVVQTRENCRENARKCYEELLEKSSIMDLVKFTETQADSKKFCTEKAESIKCIKLYKSCLTTNELDYYNDATSGIRNVHEHACYAKSEVLLSNVECFYKNRKHMDKCADNRLNYKEIIKLDDKKKCCAIKKYHLCIRKPLIANCPLRLVDLMSEMIDKYFSIVNESCSLGKEDCECFSSCAVSLLGPLGVLFLLSVLTPLLAA